MSNSKESTLQTQLSLSSDSGIFEESALISGMDFEDCIFSSLPSPSRKPYDLIAEIELINEDRQRLRQENERLQRLLAQLPMKTVQLALLQKIATKALEENQALTQNHQKPHIKPLALAKLNLRSPSENLTTRLPLKENNSRLPKKSPCDTTYSTDTSQKSQRTTSTRIRVSRNQLKYPKP